MKLVSDNLCKFLAERYPQAFAAWLLDQPLSTVRSVKVLKTELSSEPVRADSLIWLRLAREILHLEFTVRWPKEPPLEIRMLDYWVRGYRLYRVPIRQFVILLRQTRRAVPDELRVGDTYHRYRVIKLWEQDPEPLLNTPALLPLAALARAKRPVELLEEVAERVGRITQLDERREIEACTQLLAGLRFDRKLLASVFREEVMRESSTYQALVQEVTDRVLIEGRLEGRVEEARSIIYLMIKRQFGQVSDTWRAQLCRLSLAQAEELAQTMFKFQRPADLTRWLKKHASNGN